jgi:hypothetical protein
VSPQQCSQFSSPVILSVSSTSSSIHSSNEHCYLGEDDFVDSIHQDKIFQISNHQKFQNIILIILLVLCLIVWAFQTFNQWRLIVKILHPLLWTRLRMST